MDIVKVKLTKEQAKAIEIVKTNMIVSLNHELKNVLLGNINNREWFHEYEPLNDMDLDTLIKALYIGYEVEQTPEEKVLEYYNKQDHQVSLGEQYHQGVQSGIYTTLILLGITIEGITK